MSWGPVQESSASHWWNMHDVIAVMKMIKWCQVEGASIQNVDNRAENVVVEGLDVEVEDMVVAFTEQEGMVAEGDRKIAGKDTTGS